ncbi:MAG TPA: ester cyclase [Candidatus Angelobacter sp.]|jgi:predicted ester cyclase|nr:ester cyclase [Candidatus Angelobacter sp.]
MEHTPSEKKVTRIERIRRMIEDHVEEPGLHSPHFVSHAPVDIATKRHHKGPEAVAELNLRSVFSGVQLNVIKAVESGNDVIVRWRLRGKWTGALPFAPKLKPNGAAVDFTGINVYHFSGDQVVSKTSEVDVPTFMGQAMAGGAINPQACEEAAITVSRPPDAFRMGEF